MSREGGKPGSLAEFAAAQPNPKAKCPTCALPSEVREQVDAAQGVHPGSVVGKWVRGLGHQIGDDGIRRHWNSGHAVA